MPAWLRESRGALELLVHVQPRASRSEVAGEHGDRLKIRVKAPPVDGAANDALLAFLAERLSVPRWALTLVAGETGRRKTVRIEGFAPADALRALAMPAGHP